MLCDKLPVDHLSVVLRGTARSTHRQTQPVLMRWLGLVLRHDLLGLFLQKRLLTVCVRSSNHAKQVDLLPTASMASSGITPNFGVC